MKEKSEKSNWTRRPGNLIRLPLHHDGGTPSPSTRRSLVPVEGGSGRSDLAQLLRVRSCTQFAARKGTRPAVRLRFGSLTIVVQRTSVESEVVTTFSSFRFPELSQPI
jgi:hypothetical protein